MCFCTPVHCHRFWPFSVGPSTRTTPSATPSPSMPSSQTPRRHTCACCHLALLLLLRAAHRYQLPGAREGEFLLSTHHCQWREWRAREHTTLVLALSMVSRLLQYIDGGSDLMTFVWLAQIHGAVFPVTSKTVLSSTDSRIDWCWNLQLQLALCRIELSWFDPVLALPPCPSGTHIQREPTALPWTLVWTNVQGLVAMSVICSTLCFTGRGHILAHLVGQTLQCGFLSLIVRAWNSIVLTADS
jgi:hypothetical protein